MFLVHCQRCQESIAYKCFLINNVLFFFVCKLQSPGEWHDCQAKKRHEEILSNFVAFTPVCVLSLEVLQTALLAFDGLTNQRALLALQ